MSAEDPQVGDMWERKQHPKLPYTVVSRHGGFEAIREGVRIAHPFVPREHCVDLDRFLRDFEYVSGDSQ